MLVLSMVDWFKTEAEAPARIRTWKCLSARSRRNEHYVLALGDVLPKLCLGVLREDITTEQCLSVTDK